ncbi:rRNA methyltransferase 3, mitochondrial [Adelges cooleyi]|uniref:rRNA methyltransferase 3, mitochondrial n=1 Tax=Adelges cooleyi TaxID=133065 RepID=UPI0021808B63|nr:rRNA methyltransferase 3, mitochondrial [Adelges cooleyi]
MKTLCCCFSANFRMIMLNAGRTYSTELKRPMETVRKLKPHARSGVLGAVEKDDSGFPAYVILKETSPILSQAIMDTKNKKKRQKKTSILLEGKRLIQDALNVGVKPKQIFFSQKRVLEHLYLPEELRDLPVSDTIFYKTPYNMMQLFSNTTTTQGIMGIFEMPKFEIDTPKELFPITIVCDNIREPGNLGSILRTVTAVGASQIILIKGCTDLWGDKVLRSACGAHFRMKILSEVEWSSLNNIKGHVCLADNNCNIVQGDKNDADLNVFRKVTSTPLPLISYDNVDFCKSTPLILIVGGETEGLSDEGYQFAESRQGIRTYIPLLNSVESLNSATAIGILCFEARKQMMNLRNNENPNIVIQN